MKRRLLGICLAILLIAAGALWYCSTRPQLYAAFPRPDGRYTIQVYRKPVLLGMMPGQAGDAPGVVRLLDRSGKLLAETPVEMVQNVQTVDWEPRHVHIKLIADWDLPD